MAMAVSSLIKAIHRDVSHFTLPHIMRNTSLSEKNKTGWVVAQ
jgi:hypothetical protein